MKLNDNTASITATAGTARGAGVEEVGARVVQHGAPAGGGRGNTEPEEAHGGFSKDRARHTDGSLHNDGLNDVGKECGGR